MNKVMSRILFFVFTVGSFANALYAGPKKGDDLIKIISGSGFENKLNHPTGIAVNAEGDIYVNDIVNAKIKIYNLDGTFKFEFGERGPGDGKFNLPADLAIDKEGNVYVADVGLHRIQVFSPKGRFLRKFNTNDKSSKNLNMPFAVSIDKIRERVYVADTGNNRIMIFDKLGNFISSFGREGSKEGELSKPMDVDVVDREIYVADTGNSRIQIFGLDGKFLWKIGQPGSELEDLANPKGLVVDKKSGTIFVSDTDNNMIKVFNKKIDHVLFSFGVTGTVEGAFNNPQRSFIDDQGLLYIADSKNNRLQILKPVFHRNDEAAQKCEECHNEEFMEVQNKKTHVGFEKRCSDCHKLEEILKIKGIKEHKKEVCVRCHEKKMSYRYLHGPLGLGECAVCHNPHGSEKYDHLLERVDAELCSMCHEIRNKDPFVHNPVEKGKCSVCHNPHGGNNSKYTFREEGELCISCHGGINKRKYAHGPVGGGECMVCHDPHSSKEKYYLKFPESALCKTCHKEININKFTHKPVAEGKCVLCHTAHDSDNPTQLKKTGSELCFICHPNKKEEISKKFVHAPLQPGKGECVMCHTPHSSPYNFMLKNNFNPSFYLNYKIENFALCNQCHNKEIAEDEILSDNKKLMKTNFRDGDVNLHYKHVNKPKGRNCIVCHDVHASDSEFLIQSEARQGEMQGKIIFTKTDKGGRCEVGCHKPREYRR